jgi:hypothetical protein
MLPRASLILTLIVSLLFVTQARPAVMSVEMKPGGLCAAVPCVRDCCTNVTCCAAAEQKDAPQTPTPTQHQDHVQLTALELRAFTILFTPPVPRHPVVIHDDTWTAHSLPPLAVSCIRLI